jgi:O-antigen/teichoic acid export membrane protein
MQKKFVGNLLFVLLLNLLVKPFWILGIDVAVQNRVGAEEYGLYYPIFGFSILLNIFLDFGITNYNNRNIARHAHMLGRYFSGIFNIKLILGVIYLLLTLFLGWLIGYEGKEIELLLILGINQFLASLILYLRSNLSGLHLFKLEGALSVTDRLLMIAICGYLLWADRFEGVFKIEWFVYAQFAAYCVTAVIAFIIVLKKAAFFKPRFDLAVFRLILKESMPFALLVLLMSFYYRLDSVMIERLLLDGKFQAGVYAQAYRILEGFNMFGYLFAGILLPIFARMIKQNESIQALLRTSFNLIFIPSVSVAFISFLFPYEVMDLLYIDNIRESAEIFQILMISFIAIALSYVYGTLLTANGSLRELNIISGLGLLLNLLLNLWLIPIYQAKGAAMATLFTQALVISFQIFFVKRIFQIKVRLDFLLRNLMVVILIMILSYGVLKTTGSMLITLATVLLLTMILPFFSGLVSLKEVFKMFKQ